MGIAGSVQQGSAADQVVDVGLGGPRRPVNPKRTTPYIDEKIVEGHKRPLGSGSSHYPEVRVPVTTVSSQRVINFVS